MNKEAVKQEIRSRVRCTDYLEKSKSGLYVCPFCHSGKGVHQTGALKVYDTNTWTCHKCKKNGDVIDLYRERTGVDFSTALRELAQQIGISIDSPETAQNRPVSDFKTKAYKDTTKPVKTPCSGSETETEVVADYTAYYKACQERLYDPAAVSYLQSRGISLETAVAYGLGYDPEADPAIVPGAIEQTEKRHPCPRLILPVHSGYYIGRRIDGVKEHEKLNSKGCTVGIFNLAVLYTQDVREVVVTEGILDALSVIEAGYNAIALNSANNAELLVKELKKRKTEATLILSLDNDPQGRKAKKLLKETLPQLEIRYISANISAGYKDPNEALVNDRKAFDDALEYAVIMTTGKPYNTAYYVTARMTKDIARFRSDKKTGFYNLDEKANGLYEGLYVLAAISSLGKTSFALQLADQLAEQGNDVIFFSLEQSTLELVSKSLARRMAQKDLEHAVTSLAIRKGYIKPVIEESTEYSLTIGKRMNIIEGNFDCDVSFICNYIRQYIEINQVKPVVIVDYLQILQPAVEDVKRKSTKEMIDNTVTTLKRISRELGITLLVISSVNRNNYNEPVTFESLKESGGIEYTADVIWGLQLQCVNDEDFVGSNLTQKRKIVKEEKAKNPRKIELCCLKNRYGISSYSCYFDYYPANDLFVEQKEEPEYSITFQNCEKQKKANRKL